MPYANIIRSALTAITVAAAGAAHATDWSLNVLEGCGGQVSGTFSTNAAGLVTSANLLLMGGGCSVPASGIRYDSSAANIITTFSANYFHLTSSSIGGSSNLGDNLFLEFANPLTATGAAAGYNSLVFHNGGPFGGLTSARIDRFADSIFIAGYAAPLAAAVPEPGTFAMMLAGCALFGGLTRRRRLAD